MAEKITPEEFTAILNLVSKAPTTVGEVYSMNVALTKFVALANQPHPVGAISPALEAAAATLALADSGLPSSDSSPAV